MEKINDGGAMQPSFTGMVSKEFQGTSDDSFIKVIKTELVELDKGLSIRDYFAACAMQALLARSSVVIPNNDLAKDCYKVADAMIKERENER